MKLALEQDDFRHVDRIGVRCVRTGHVGKLLLRADPPQREMGAEAPRLSSKTESTDRAIDGTGQCADLLTRLHIQRNHAGATIGALALRRALSPVVWVGRTSGVRCFAMIFVLCRYCGSSVV